MFGCKENLVKLWKLGGWLGFLPLVFACSRSSIEIFCFLLDEMQQKKKKLMTGFWIYKIFGNLNEFFLEFAISTNVCLFICFPNFIYNLLCSNPQSSPSFSSTL